MDVFSAIIAPLLLLAVFVLAVWLMLKMNEDKFKGVNKLASLISAAGIGLILLVLFGSTLAAVKGMILCMILMYASISDIWRREVPDYVWAMIAITIITLKTSPQRNSSTSSTARWQNTAC